MVIHAPCSWCIRLSSLTPSLYLRMGLGVYKSFSDLFCVHGFLQQKDVTVAREGNVVIRGRTKISKDAGKMRKIFQGKEIKFLLREL